MINQLSPGVCLLLKFLQVGLYSFYPLWVKFVVSIIQKVLSGAIWGLSIHHLEIHPQTFGAHIFVTNEGRTLFYSSSAASGCPQAGVCVAGQQSKQSWSCSVPAGGADPSWVSVSDTQPCSFPILSQPGAASLCSWHTRSMFLQSWELGQPQNDFS